MASFAVILPAAGLSARFGGGRNKLLEPLGGYPVIARTYQVFARRADVAGIVIPTGSPDRIRAALGALLNPPNLEPRFCDGGASRAHSVRNALRAVPPEVEWIAVHDAARPLVSDEVITGTFAAALKYGAAVPALPAALTIKQAQGPLPAKVEATLPRAMLWSMQTPQIMRRAALLDAFESCPLPLEQITDDAQVLELAGQEVWLVPGDERNLKITTAQDLCVAEMLDRTGLP